MNDEKSNIFIINGKTLVLPAFFPSISSVKTSLYVKDYLSILIALSGLVERFLISAFDIDNIKDDPSILEIFNSEKFKKMITLMDSGNYESFWKDKQNIWSKENFHYIANKFSCDLTFGFDDQTPPSNDAIHIKKMIDQFDIDQKYVNKSKVIPIIHSSEDKLPTICRRFVEITDTDYIAVPERRLGTGIIQRAKTIYKIREELNKLGKYILLHILGTGNPLSICIFAIQGADSFDGLEWCQTIIDYETITLHHITHADFFLGQNSLDNNDLSYNTRILLHNIKFMEDWMTNFQKAKNREDQIYFCQRFFPKPIFNVCNKILGWR